MAVKKAPKTPEEPTMLLTLTEEQASLVSEALREVEIHSRAAQSARKRLDELLAMVRPLGANTFDPKSMTFYSVPPSEPKE